MASSVGARRCVWNSRSSPAPTSWYDVESRLIPAPESIRLVARWRPHRRWRRGRRWMRHQREGDARRRVEISPGTVIGATGFQTCAGGRWREMAHVGGVVLVTARSCRRATIARTVPAGYVVGESCRIGNNVRLTRRTADTAPPWVGAVMNGNVRWATTHGSAPEPPLPTTSRSRSTGRSGATVIGSQRNEHVVVHLHRPPHRAARGLEVAVRRRR